MDCSTDISDVSLHRSETVNTQVHNAAAGSTHESQTPEEISKDKTQEKPVNPSQPKPVAHVASLIDSAKFENLSLSPNSADDNACDSRAGIMSKPSTSTSRHNLLKKVLMRKEFTGSKGSRHQKVEIFAPNNNGPKWYNVQSPMLTQLLLPDKLKEAYSYMPCHGRPDDKETLQQFQDKKIREFIGCDLNDEEYAKLSEMCSTKHMETGDELKMPTAVPSAILLNADTKATTDYTARHQDKPELSVVKKNRHNKSQVTTKSLLKRLKYRGLRMIPLEQQKVESPSSNPPSELLRPGTESSSNPPSELLRPGTDLSSNPPSELLRPGTESSSNTPSELLRPGTESSSNPPSELLRPGTDLSSNPPSELLRPGTESCSNPPSELLRPGTESSSNPSSELLNPGTDLSSNPSSELLNPGIDLSSNPSSELLNPGTDLLYILHVYRPFLYNVNYRNVQSSLSQSRHSVLSRDIILTGRTPLSALREYLSCVNDADARLDVSTSPEQTDTCAKEVFPSGFLFINNVFYVDERPGCKDLSACIREWASTNRNIGRFVKRPITELMKDVPIALGHPEVYVHQGNCEHLFTISDVRLVSFTDPLALSHYPCHTTVSLQNSLYCTICAEFNAKWIVTGCKRVPFDPSLLCDHCLKPYLYKDGQKICDFKLYSYSGKEDSIFNLDLDE